MVAKYQISWVF